MSIYPYQKIPTTHIRLMRLVRRPPCDHDINGILNYELVSFPLESCPSYMALSYTWGAENPNQNIIIDGHNTPVQNNLHAFLRRHYNSLPQSNLDETYLWVDAICINQLDKHEKSLQLTLMGEIYKRANHIGLWLGEDSHDSAVAIDCWLRLVDKVRQGGLIKPADLSIRETRALDNLALRNYWHRVWVWQEASTPNTPSYIICGDKQIALEDAFVANDAVRTMMLNSYRVTKLIPWVPKLQAMYELARIRSSYASTEEFANDPPLGGSADWDSLMSMLFATRDLQATDPRDKIYALFPIYRDIRGRLPFRVCDGKAVEESYRDACTFILEREQDLRLFLLCNASSVPASSQSWIPNFTHLVQPFEIFRSQGLFDASGSKPPHISIDNRMLVKVRGVRVDPIVTTHQGLTCPNEHESSFDIEYWQPKFQVWFRSIAKFISKGEGDRNYHRYIQLSEAADQLLSLGLCPGLKLRRTGSVFHWPVFDVAAGADPPSVEEVRSEFVDLFLRLGHASLFWTAHGYLGLGDMCIRSGDIVVVLYGLSIPMVLRRTALFWRIIGPCFVVGMMDGEALRLRAWEEEFTIF
ncbi:HET-domain-containing protein [Annulohypoxylon truncatum]|uniref:HET-domain-containing protein n=1 Tax=Annulohypoxylon truncatum TaxID=327061 RepID=UPI0020089DB7|nr:HET-domain-containing protein [Annulohypoxylon truncatum]KAI1205494.1 HET-domain-containing protein [Annulohypoxylon truncatum]